MRSKILFAAIVLAAGVLSSTAQSNPSSPNGVDTEMKLEWPDGQFYIKSFNYIHDERYIWYPDLKIHSYWDKNWQEAAGGNGSSVFVVEYPILDQSTNAYVNTWPGGRWPDLADGVMTTLPSGATNDCGPAVPTVPFSYNGVYGGSLNYDNSDGYSGLHESDDWQVMLLTGGTASSSDSELYEITANAIETIITDQSWPGALAPSIVPEQIQIGSLGSLTTAGTDYAGRPYGTMYAVLPSHTTVPTTVHVNGSKRYAAYFSAQGHKLVSQCVANTPANSERRTIGVGERVICSMVSSLTVGWSASGGSVSPPSGIQTTFTAPSNAANVTVTATIQDQSISIPFHVIEPSGYVSALITSTENNGYYGTGHAGAGMYLQPIIIGPTNVSFGRVSVMEIGEVATNATGYFANSNTWPADNLDHNTHGANVWRTLNENNSIAAMDHASSGTCIPPWSSGNFTWPIPVGWRVGNSPVTNIMGGWSQNFLIDASGTVTVQKFGHSVTRTTNDVITTQ